MSDLITRRAAIARAAYLMGGALSASTLAGVLAGCVPRAAGVSGARSLSSDQSELVGLLSDHIIPPTDTPGASAAGVPDFIDVMLTEYYPADESARFLAGLDRLARRAEAEFGAPFAKASPEQRLALVDAYNRQAFGEAAAGETEPEASTIGGAWDPADVGRRAFFRTFKELVLVGYYTSKPGATQELRMNPMGSWQADIPYASESGRAWA